MFQMLIDGAMTDGALPHEVINPATEEIVAVSSRASQEQMEQAIAAAKRAYPGWAATPIETRSEALLALSKAIQDNADDIARILTQEQGKPLSEATREMLGAAAIIGAIAKLRLPVELIEDSDVRHVELHRVPLGVVAAICPWNFPILLPAVKLAPALLAGNTMVLKPSPTTPLTMLSVAKLAVDLFPAGVLNVVTDENDLGPMLSSHPDIAKVSFTGSTATGSRVMASAAADIKRITLELGGNDAAIVLDDVDPKGIAEGLFTAAFGNSGQVCIASKRLYVQDGVFDAVCAELVALAEAAVVDDGLKQGTTLGPIQNKVQFEKLKAMLEEVKAEGKILTGGQAEDGPGYFIKPTIVTDVPETAKIVQEEQFGPILPVLRFTDEDDVVRRANASVYGLGASVWTSNPERARRLSLALEAGTVWVNKAREILPHVPFSGAKQSGLGVEMARQGLEEFTQVKVINAKA